MQVIYAWVYLIKYGMKNGMNLVFQIDETKTGQF